MFLAVVKFAHFFTPKCGLIPIFLFSLSCYFLSLSRSLSLSPSFTFTHTKQEHIRCRSTGLCKPFHLHFPVRLVSISFFHPALHRAPECSFLPWTHLKYSKTHDILLPSDNVDVCPPTPHLQHYSSHLILYWGSAFLTVLKKACFFFFFQPKILKQNLPLTDRNAGVHGCQWEFPLSAVRFNLSSHWPSTATPTLRFEQ